MSFDPVSYAAGKKAAGGGGQPNLQSKTVTPTVSQQTVSPDAGYDGLSSVTVNAVSPVKAAQTYTPRTTNQTIAAGRWLTGAQTIKGDAGLVASNIKRGVSIFGVVGNYAGECEVTFYDIPYVIFGGTMFFAVVEDSKGTHCDIKAGKYESFDWGAWNTTGSGGVQYQPMAGVTVIGIYSDGVLD